MAILLFLIIRGMITKFLFHELPGYWEILLLIFSSAGIIGTVFYLFNLYGLNSITAKVFNLPYLRGVYEGELISQYHINDDPQKPKVKKIVRLKASQNLNGFYMAMKFFDTIRSKQASSLSYNVTHHIEPLGNGTFRITYQYENDPDRTHKDEKKYGLNLHRGMADFIYDPKDKSLRGQYWNNPKDRNSFGTIELIRIK